MIRLPSHGYTIIEVMIFLAITGLLFASAVSAVSGNQRNVQYSQAVRDFETQLKDVANDVSNGYYPSYERGRCKAIANGTKIGFDNAGGAVGGDPGANVDCINAGKTLMFNLDPERIGIGVIVGLNPGIGETQELSLDTLAPTLAYQNNGLNAIDLTEYKPIRFGAKVTKIGSDTYPGVSYSSLSFITDFNSSSAENRSENGTLTTNVYGIIANGGITANSTMADYRDDIEELGNLDPSFYDVNPIDGFYVCLLTSDNRRARVFLGVDGAVTATKTEFDLDAGAICP